MPDESLPASVHYRLSLPRPESHLVDVSMRICQASRLGPELVLRMAAWSPGSYLIRDYARFVRNLHVSENGVELPVLKLDKQTWRVTRPGEGSETAEGAETADGSVTAEGAGTAEGSETAEGAETAAALAAATDEVLVRYQVYGHDLTVRTNHIDDSHAFLHGPATYLMVDGLRTAPCHVHVDAPESEAWVIATGLEPDGDGYRADGLDELLDCPVHMSRADRTQERAMDVAGSHVRLVVWGKVASTAVANLDTLAKDLSAIVAAHAARFDGRIPCARYTFILMLSPGAYGGLEHKSSSANLHNPFCFESDNNYYGLLELLSHEFFHVWNGKRIFPEAHAPFDYGREAYTRCLWVMEGLTSYYDRYTTLHASPMTAKRYLGKLAEEWNNYLGIVGREVQSLEEASFDAWIKLYKPDESNINTTVSYYLAGGLAALALDLEIRARTEWQRGLDQVLDHLWREYGERGVPYPEDVQEVFEHASGLDLSGFFDQVIRGRKAPDLADALAQVGLRLEPEGGPSSKDGGKDDSDGNGNGNDNGNGNGNGDGDGNGDGAKRPRVWLGAILGKRDGRVSQVLDHSPADRAGLSPGDVIIAIDDWQVSGKGEIDKRLQGRAPDDVVELAVFRQRQLTRVHVTLEQAPPRRMAIVASDASDAERARYATWLGEDHPGAGPVASGPIAHWT